MIRRIYGLPARSQRDYVRSLHQSRATKETIGKESRCANASLQPLLNLLFSEIPSLPRHVVPSMRHFSPPGVASQSCEVEVRSPVFEDVYLTSNTHSKPE